MIIIFLGYGIYLFYTHYNLNIGITQQEKK
jgi:hypothetical protein